MRAVSPGARKRGSETIVTTVGAVLRNLAAFLLQMALTRSREYEADRSGARLIGEGEPLARALAKIEAGVRAVPQVLKNGTPTPASPQMRSAGGWNKRFAGPSDKTRPSR